MSAGSHPRFDVVVVGAGPAGSVAAGEAAVAGLRVLLVERARLPRYKVCGCCLGPNTLRSLARLGVEPGSAAQPLRYLQIQAWGRRLQRSIDGNVAISRERLDEILVRRACRNGVELMSPWQAGLGRTGDGVRHVELRGVGGVRHVSAYLVVLANGIAGGLDRPPARRCGRVGLGRARFDDGVDLQPGVVRMAVAEQGYVGLVRLADGRINVAASLRLQHVRRAGAGAVVDSVLAAAGHRPLGWRHGWKGTPELRRWRRRRTTDRVLVLGDAGGFGEPFTGEGIGWALRSALRSGDAIARLAHRWSPVAARRWARRERWARRRDEVGGRLVSTIVAHPPLARAVMMLAQGWPATLRWIAPGVLPPQPRAGGAG